ncbi:RNA methyltransferase [Treponema sp. TIM-1]|uniref:TrmH family RNA methyltransferase n=1 Tax=Treponema sp. TIM-1 TaxID=2898417 RepID=UPI00397F01AD
MRNKLTNELAVCGFNAVAALGEYHPEKINRLFLREDRLKQFTRVCKNLAERKRPYKLCEDEELERICKSPRHQGVVAMIEEPVVEPVEKMDIEHWAGEGKTGLVLHSVGNDHNLGAMVRSAAFFDAPLIILSEGDLEARLTTSAYRVAEGGMEQVTFRKVGDTGAFIKSLSRSVITIGTDMRARLRIRDLGVIIRERAGLLRGSPAGKHRPGEYVRPGIALVVGNEETGLPPTVKEHCSALVRIPGTGIIESLNVAQAATLFLHEIYEL